MYRRKVDEDKLIWTQLPGLARDISTSHNKVWVITANDDPLSHGNGKVYELAITNANWN